MRLFGFLFFVASAWTLGNSEPKSVQTSSCRVFSFNPIGLVGENEGACWERKLRASGYQVLQNLNEVRPGDLGLATMRWYTVGVPELIPLRLDPYLYLTLNEVAVPRSDNDWIKKNYYVGQSIFHPTSPNAKKSCESFDEDIFPTCVADPAYVIPSNSLDLVMAGARPLVLARRNGHDLLVSGNLEGCQAGAPVWEEVPIPGSPSRIKEFRYSPGCSNGSFAWIHYAEDKMYFRSVDADNTQRLGVLDIASGKVTWLVIVCGKKGAVPSCNYFSIASVSDESIAVVADTGANFNLITTSSQKGAEVLLTFPQRIEKAGNIIFLGNQFVYQPKAGLLYGLSVASKIRGQGREHRIFALAVPEGKTLFETVVPITDPEFQLDREKLISQKDRVLVAVASLATIETFDVTSSVFSLDHSFSIPKFYRTSGWRVPWSLQDVIVDGEKNELSYLITVGQTVLGNLSQEYRRVSRWKTKWK